MRIGTRGHRHEAVDGFKPGKPALLYEQPLPVIDQIEQMASMTRHNRLVALKASRQLNPKQLQ